MKEKAENGNNSNHNACLYQHLTASGTTSLIFGWRSNLSSLRVRL
jgi:hypothetical protein